MHPIVKIFIGLLLMAASVWWVWQGPHPTSFLSIQPGTNLADFITVLNGAIPPFVFLLGVFIVWLEYDEWKIERELKAEEERERKRKARRRAKRRRKR